MVVEFYEYAWNCIVFGVCENHERLGCNNISIIFYVYCLVTRNEDRENFRKEDPAFATGELFIELKGNLVVF